MYNSKYYTCEQIDQRLLDGYYDDAVAAGYTGSKAQYLAGLLKAINYSANPTITADKVVYNPAISGLTPKNVQGAIDELANKKFDKASIVQESGESEDKVMSQKAVSDKFSDLVTSLKNNFSYKGIAKPTTNPGVPDSNVFYIAGEGSYPNFNNQVVEVGQIAVLKWDGSWHKEVLEIGADGGNMILDWNTDVATTRKQVLQKYRKQLLQISYKNTNGDIVNEQYVGTLFTDTEWVKDANWEASVKQKQINALSNQILEEVDKIENGYSQEFEEINIGNVTDGQMLKNGIVTPFNGRAVSDMFNVEKYRGLTLTCLYIGNFGDSNCYAFYDALGNVQSYGRGTSIYQNILIPNDASQMRLSCTSANISKLSLFLNSEKSLGISSLEEINLALNLIPVNKKYVVGSTLETFTPIGSQFGIEIPSARFTKAKIYVPTDRKVKLGVITYNKDIYKYVPYKLFTFEAKTGTDLYDIDLNLIGKQKSYLVFLEGVGYGNGTPQYPGVYLYNVGGYPSLRNDSEIKAYPSNENKGRFRFTVDLLYDEAVGISEEPVETMVLSDTFKGKDYVSYGDSITQGAKKDETGSETYGLCIANYFGFNYINKGQSGTIPYGQGQNANLTDANLEAVTENTRLVTISGGQNRWVTDEDINSQNRTTSIGSINYYIDQIRLRSPKCVIILCPTYIGNGDNQCAKDYQRIADNKHVGLAPTLDLHLIDWEGDKSVNLLRYDNVHLNAFGAKKFAAVVREYARQFFF